MSVETFHYETIQEFGRAFYADLLTAAHQVGERKEINLGTKEEPDKHVFYIYKKNLKMFALPEEHVNDLPILVTNTKRKTHYRDVLDIITGYKSARFRPEKKMSFRKLVDDLCPFEHEAPRDYALWKIIAFSSLIGRTAFRVCSPPAFGKDSVMKVLGFLTSDVCVIANPTVAKLEYRLMGNKVLMLNEFANLKAEDRYGMEHFLQSVGDMSPIYEKRSRAGIGTAETFNIGELSVLCAYNNLDCYADDSKYFDAVFSAQTKDRFIPFKFHGKIAQQIPHVTNPAEIAKKQSDYLQSIIRTITYYKIAWRDELSERAFLVKNATDYGFEGRWANNFDKIRDFIILYANDAEEATLLLNTLYNRHVDYLEQFKQSEGLFRQYHRRESEELITVEENV